jgi:Fe-S cluster assembly iron-binding protein IscA
MGLFSSIKDKFKGGTRMNVIIQPEVLNGLKNELKSMNKDVVRFDIVSFGWSGPIFDIVLDEQKENDAFVEIDGVKFAADSEIAPLIKNPEIIKDENRFTVKKTECC